jgi:hypothetical protein
MIRGGVSQAVAMSISGHKTVSMFYRYNITSAADKIDALRKLESHLASQPKEEDKGVLLEIPDLEAAK